MPFTPGQSGNPSGRPPGSQNKAKKQLREMIAEFLLNNFEKVQEEFDKLEGKDKVKFYCQLLPYGLAKVKPEPDMNLDKLTEEEIDRIIKILIDAVQQSFKEPWKQITVPARAADG